METTIHDAPLIPVRFNPHLLSIPTFGFSARHLLSLAEWVEKRILRAEFRKFPATIQALKQKHQQLMELYERTKIEEGKAKEKAFVKAHAPFYRPRLDNKNDERLFERLNDRRRMSVASSGGKNYKV